MWSPVHATTSSACVGVTQSSASHKKADAGSGVRGGEGDEEQRCPVMRCKHAMCASQDDGRIYLFGGRKGSMPLKDLWRFDPLLHQWQEVLVRGSTHPPSLQEHTINSWNVSCFLACLALLASSTHTHTHSLSAQSLAHLFVPSKRHSCWSRAVDREREMRGISPASCSLFLSSPLSCVWILS